MVAHSSYDRFGLAGLRADRVNGDLDLFERVAIGIV